MSAAFSVHLDVADLDLDEWSADYDVQRQYARADLGAQMAKAGEEFLHTLGYHAAKVTYRLPQ